MQEGGGEYKNGLSAMSETTASGCGVGIQPPDHHSVTTDKPISNKRLIKGVYHLPSAKENINIPSSTAIETTADTVIIGGKKWSFVLRCFYLLEVVNFACLKKYAS